MATLIASSVLATSSCGFLATAALAGSCFTGAQRMSPEALTAEETAIKANMAAWLAGHSARISSAIRDIAASDPDFAATIAAQGKNAKPEDAAAIGSGLGQAATTCQANQAEATKIQNAAAGSENESLIASYSSTTGNSQTASTGAGAGGGGAASGGIGGGGTGGGIGQASTGQSVGGGGGAAPASAPAPTPNKFQNLLTGGTIGSVGSLTITNTTNVTSGAVSVSSF